MRKLGPQPFSLTEIGSEEKRSFWHRLEKLPILVAVFVAIPSVVSFYKDYPRLGLALLSLPAIFVLWALLPFIKNGLVAISNTIRQQWLAWRNASQLREFASRFEEFVDHDNPSTLRNILFNMCDNNWEETEQFLPPDYIPDWFHCFQVQLRTSVFTFSRFAHLAHHFSYIVKRYNDDYVIRGQNKIRRWCPFPSDKDQLPELSPEEVGRPNPNQPKEFSEHYREKLEVFRDTWVRFLRDYQEWNKSLNRKMPAGSNTRFMVYFPIPGRF